MSLKDKLEALKKSKEHEESIDWEHKKNQYIQNVEGLYSKIQSWLSDYKNADLIDFRRNIISLREHGIGNYDIDGFEISMGNESVIFEPIGQNILGAWGRVDFYLTGRVRDKVILVLIGDEKKGKKWVVVQERTKMERLDFDKDFLEATLDTWLGSLG